MKIRLYRVILPVHDIDRATAFYAASPASGSRPVVTTSIAAGRS